jgi:hypothetical protein
MKEKNERMHENDVVKWMKTRKAQNKNTEYLMSKDEYKSIQEFDELLKHNEKDASIVKNDAEIMRRLFREVLPFPRRNQRENNNLTKKFLNASLDGRKVCRPIGIHFGRMNQNVQNRRLFQSPEAHSRPLEFSPNKSINNVSSIIKWS